LDKQKQYKSLATCWEFVYFRNCEVVSNFIQNRLCKKLKTIYIRFAHGRKERFIRFEDRQSILFLLHSTFV